MTKPVLLFYRLADRAMPNPGGFGELGFAKAKLEIEQVFHARAPDNWRRLTDDEVGAYRPKRSFVGGWRVTALFSDSETREIDVLVGPNFPAGYPRTALVDGPEFLVWPHVESDGILCLLPIMAEVDAEKPGEVAWQLLRKSVTLIEELLEGSIINRDFREEFLTYWAYVSSGGTKVHSLLAPERPSREIWVWRDTKDRIAVADDKAALSQWLRNNQWKSKASQKNEIERGVFIWMSQAPLPADYPETGADLLQLATQAGDGARELLVDVAASLPKQLTAIIGAEGRGGPGLIAASTTANKMRYHVNGRVEAPLTKGFPPNLLPRQIAALRTFSTNGVVKANVQRADVPWIHGRGNDGRTITLFGKTALLIGCGSVGSSIIARLARAGVGAIHIVDYDTFSWSNLGRHELGASSIGKNKAVELAARLQRDFPHLSFFGHAASAHWLISAGEKLLAASDIVISTTGSWDADGALNRWHLATGRKKPFLYGWTETHAAAGHAVTIAANDGCLRCGVGPTGIPEFIAASWEKEGSTIEEPACGNHYTPYGAVELGFVVDLIAEAALEALLLPPPGSRHRVWLAPKRRIEEAGGKLTDDLTSQHPEATSGGQILDRPWCAGACSVCGDVSCIMAA